jgi:hypothetical protein
MPDQNHQTCYRYRDTRSASAELSREDGDKAWQTKGAHPQPSRCYDLNFPRKHGVGETLLPTIAIVQSRKSARADWLSECRKKQGELELAKNYAARCYKTLIDSDDFLKDARLETLLKQWLLRLLRTIIEALY